MGLLKLKTKISVEDYLISERISPVRREYFFGEVYPRPDNDANHCHIVGNLLTLLVGHLRESSYETFSCDLKVKIDENIVYYPDVFVSSQENPYDSYFRTHLILVAEVASSETKQIDYREKVFAYQQISSVQEYIVIDQHRINIELHRRQSNGNWITYYFDASDDEVEFQSVGLTMPINEIYRRVQFERNADRNNH